MTKFDAMPRKSPFWWFGYVPVALFVVALLYLIVTAGESVLVPLLLAMALTFMLEPVAARLESRGQSRSIAVLLTLFTALVVVGAVLIFLLPSIYHQLLQSIDKLPLALRAVASKVQELLGFARQHLSSNLFDQLESYLAEFKAHPSALTSRIGGWLSKGLFGLVSVGSASLGLVIVPFFVYYLLLDLNRLKDLLENQIPPRHRSAGVRLVDEIGDVLRSYVRGRFLIACIMATIYSAGLLILRVPLWAGIGFIAGVLGIIPYLGVTSGLILAVGFAALDSAGLGRLAGVLVVFVIAQLTEDYVLTPRIIGGKLALHPMLVFIALIVAGDLYGLLGLVLAIPALAVLKVIVRFLDELYLRSDLYLAPATSSSGEVKDHSSMQRAAMAAAKPAKELMHESLQEQSK